MSLSKEQIALVALQAVVEGLIGLFKRHQQGENVTADLEELLGKVQALKNKEQAIADGSLTSASVSGTLTNKK